jgi:methyl-accepting chemotaxis protein
VGDDVVWIAGFDAEGALVAERPAAPEGLDAAAAGRAAMDSGKTVATGDYIAAPIRFGKDNAIAGALVIGWSDAQLIAQIWRNAVNLALIGAGIAVVMMIGAYFFISGLFVAPILAVGEAMRSLSDGQLDLTIPGRERRDEIGEMARNTEDFRLKIAEGEKLRSAQAARDAETARQRAAMMEELENGIGAVVSAAKSGVFGQRVELKFDDQALNNLGAGVNDICETIDNFLRATERAVGALSEGDLTCKMTGRHSGRFGEVAQSVDTTIDNLAALISDLIATSQTMHSSVETLVVGAQNFSERTEAQAAALEQTAATMEEISSTVTITAENVRSTAHGAGEVKKRAVQGQEVVTDAVTAMGEIERGSKHITDIITLIDDIAFQTNLLALNAAVEAARAGDAGKGFAVVANEVRTLAQRSADAANDIKRLITQSQESVEDGARLVRATGEALDAIISSADEVSTSVAGISTATDEQATSVSEISSTISSLDEATQQNAQVAERSALAAGSLRELAERLSQQVAFFKQSEAEEPVALSA